MGMFDYVKHRSKCPDCGEIVEPFQTKDAECVLDVLDHSDKRIHVYYAQCRNCKTFIEYTRTTRPVTNKNP